MTTRVFSPTVPPAAPLEITVKSSINRIEFGDGYSEDSPQGINAQKRVVQIRWVLQKEQVSSIYNFLREEAGWGRISYMLPGDDTTALWIASEIKVVMSAGKSVVLSVMFTETFL